MLSAGRSINVKGMQLYYVYGRLIRKRGITLIISRFMFYTQMRVIDTRSHSFELFNTFFQELGTYDLMYADTCVPEHNCTGL